ncbi:MAG: peptidoglycan-binding protein [Hyphomicrobiaceae bacterium]|nr:peptidoglycan-binding protein [Hyphomicrobiaceae bacterium]
MKSRARAAEAYDDYDDGWDEPPRGGRRHGSPAGELPWRIAAMCRDNPLKAGGIFVGLLTAALIVSNALNNQHGRHPAPLFETRGVSGPISQALPVPEPAPTRAVRTTPVTAQDVAARDSQPAAAPAPAPAPGNIEALIQQTAPAAAPAVVEDPRVRALQAVLKDRGLYTGSVDGISGPMTSDAIRALEKQLNITQTGEYSDRLLVLAQKARPVVTPPQPTRVGAMPIQNASFSPAEPRTVATVPVIARPQVAPPRPAQPAAATPQTDMRAGVADDRTAKVQRALAALGFTPGKADGRMRPETAEAIKRFEIDKGLKVTGTINDQLMFALASTGSLY